MSKARTITREVTKTTVVSGKVQMTESGEIESVLLPEIVLVGNRDVRQAQRHIDKLYPDEQVTALSVQAETTVYQMPIEEFIKVATIKED